MESIFFTGAHMMPFQTSDLNSAVCTTCTALRSSLFLTLRIPPGSCLGVGNTAMNFIQMDERDTQYHITPC